MLAACSQLVSLWMKKSSPHLLDDDADRTTRWSRAIKQVRLQTRVAAAASSSKSPRTPGSAFRDGIRRGSVASVASAARRLSVFSGLSRGRSRGVSDAPASPRDGKEACDEGEAPHPPATQRLPSAHRGEGSDSDGSRPPSGDGRPRVSSTSLNGWGQL